MAQRHRSVAPGPAYRRISKGTVLKLARSTLLAYALPALPLAALTLPLYVIVPTFYTEALGLPLATVAAVLAAVRIFDAVNDPVLGWMADRWRPAFGRRRAFFLLSLPLTALASLMLFWPPDGAGGWWLGVSAAALSIGYTASLLPYTAWGAEMAGDYGERSRVTAWRETLTLVGTLAAIAIPFSIGLETPGRLHGLAWLGIGVAVALPMTGALAVWRTPEPREYGSARLSLRDGLRGMAANRPFVRLIAAYLLNGLANGIPATLFLYFVSDRLGMPDLRGPLLFGYFACGVAGVPLALLAARRLGKHRAWSLVMLATCAVFAFVPLIGEGEWIAFAVVCALTGLALGFDLSLPPSIQADVIDVDTAASGEQRSGAYFAAWSLATKLSLALGLAVAFPLLAAFGFEPGGSANGPDALFALAAVYAWLPIAFKLAAIALMWNFPVDAGTQAELRRGIEARG